MYDLFISYAPSNRLDIVDPFVTILKDHDLSLWYDAFEIEIGDSITNKISQGLQKARYGLIIISKDYAKSKWACQELNSFFSKQINIGKKYILPLWYKISYEEVYSLFPLLGDYYAIQINQANEQNLKTAARKITMIVKGENNTLKNNSTSHTEIEKDSQEYRVQRFRNLISQGKIENAIDYVHNNFDLQDKVLKSFSLLTAQHNILKENFHKNIISNEEFTVNNNKIILSFLELLS